MVGPRKPKAPLSAGAKKPSGGPKPPSTKSKLKKETAEFSSAFDKVMENLNLKPKPTAPEPPSTRAPRTPNQLANDIGLGERLAAAQREKRLADLSPDPSPSPSTATNHRAPVIVRPPDPSTYKPILPNNWVGLAGFYNFMFYDRGFQCPPHLMPVIHALADSRIEKLLVVAGPGSGKSLLVTVCYPAFALAMDPSLTILGVSAGENLMQGFQLTVMEWIEYNPVWRLLFPHVRPDKDKGWSTERGLYVTGHRSGDPDATFFAAGLTSKALTGKHARLLNFDDLHDKENSASVESCLKVRETYYRQLMGRADPRGARMVCSARRWHEEDLYGHWKASGDWVVMELPAIRDRNEGRLYWDITIPEGLICCFNDPNPAPLTVDPKGLQEMLRQRQDEQMAEAVTMARMQAAMGAVPGQS